MFSPFISQPLSCTFLNFFALDEMGSRIDDLEKSLADLMAQVKERERGREERKEKKREGGRKGKRERGREGGMEREKEGERKEGR